jgi:hypothetical protein
VNHAHTGEHFVLAEHAKGGDMSQIFKAKHLLAASVVVAAALTVAGSALGFAGPPVGNQEFRPPPDVHPVTWCGQVEGTAVDTIVEHYMMDAGGNIIDNVRFTRVFTATATGKAIVSSASTTEKSHGPIDNGDGTIRFVTATNGLALKFKALDGSVLKAADASRCGVRASWSSRMSSTRQRATTSPRTSRSKGRT